MAVFIALGVAVLLGLGVLTVSAVATLVNWLVLVGAVVGGLGLFYQLIQEDRFTSLFDSEAAVNVAAGIVSAAAAFLSFKLLSAAFAALGFAAALVAGLLITAGFVFGPVYVVNGLVTAAEILLGLLEAGGE